MKINYAPPPANRCFVQTTPLSSHRLVTERRKTHKKIFIIIFTTFATFYNRLVRVRDGNLRVAVLCELLSVAVNAVDTMAIPIPRGDGAVGFATAVVLRHRHPGARIVVFGHSEAKQRYFSFAESAQATGRVDGIEVAFECVGGNAVSEVVDEMIGLIRPQGVINLLGVSEYRQGLNTRMILEKGLTVRGHSRSSRGDFEEAAGMIDGSGWVRESLQSIISEEVPVRSAGDIHMAFERDTYNDFKTVLKWGV